jgi:hypothetical protein
VQRGIYLSLLVSALVHHPLFSKFMSACPHYMGHFFMTQLPVPSCMKARSFPLSYIFSTAYIQLNSITHKQTLYIYHYPCQYYIHCTNSLSALHSLHNYTSDHPVITETQHHVSTISKVGKYMIFCWVPGHTALPCRGHQCSCAPYIETWQ